MSSSAAATDVVSAMSNKKKDQTITILVLGDDQVGKSSLLSTFVSRHFVEHGVPGLMTRVQLPPHEWYGKTVLVDSQQGDQALLSCLPTTAASNSTTSSSNTSQVTPPPPKVDSILLVYDLSRPNTFERLEQHWLPLIERVYNGKVPVIVAENKYDLFAEANASASSSAISTTSSGGLARPQPSDQALQRKRQQIVALMQRFPFVRQCIKCSAKDFWHVDDIFWKAQQAVLFPFLVLFDLEKGRLSLKCQRALQRIFRMCDLDQDGLLNQAEMDHFQRHVAYFGADWPTWKKIVKGHSAVATDDHLGSGNTSHEAVLSPDGQAFTVTGFLVLFDVLINQNRLDRVWEALRKFGYNDELQLEMPDELQEEDGNTESTSRKLTREEKSFLVRLFQRHSSSTASNKGTGTGPGENVTDHRVLSTTDLHDIFTVVDPPLPPWSAPRASHIFRSSARPKQYKGQASSPSSSSPDTSSLVEGEAAHQVSDQIHDTVRQQTSRLPQQHPLSSSGISILSASDSLPSLGSLAASLPSTNVNLSSPAKQTLNAIEWMGHWHLMVATNPIATRQELYRLGYVAPSSPMSKQLRLSPSSKSGTTFRGKKSVANSLYRSREIRVLVLGCTRKSQLIESVCLVSDESGNQLPSSSSSTNVTETSQAHVKINRAHRRRSSSKSQVQDLVSHFIFFDVSNPSSALTGELAMDTFDLVLMAFDSIPTLDLCQRLEQQYVADDLPRVFVALSSLDDDDDDDSKTSSVLQAATRYVTTRELEGQPLVWTLAIKNVESVAAAADEFLTVLARSCLRDAGLDDLLLSSPYEALRRRREHLFQIGLGVMGVVVVIGVGYFSLASSWFQSLFVPSGGSSARSSPSSTRRK